MEWKKDCAAPETRNREMRANAELPSRAALQISLTERRINGELCRRREGNTMRTFCADCENVGSSTCLDCTHVHEEGASDSPTEDGTDGTSDGLPVREADGPLVASVYSSPLPVHPNRFYNESGSEVCIWNKDIKCIQEHCRCIYFPTKR
jgi:hypothetical protein